MSYAPAPISATESTPISSGAQRKHSSRACLECRKRHTKCDGKATCTNCVVNKRLCEYVSSKRGGFRVPRATQAQQYAIRQFPRVAAASAQPDEPEHQKLIRYYYDYFHLDHPIFPVKETHYLADLSDKPDVEAVLKLYATSVECNLDTREEQRQKVEDLQNIFGKTPNDLIKMQAATMGSLVVQMFGFPDIADNFRDKAIDILLSTTLKSDRVKDTSSFETSAHELYSLDVLVMAAVRSGRSRLASGSMMSSIAPPTNESSQIKFHVTNLVDRALQKQQAEPYLQSIVAAWEELLKDRLDSQVQYAYMVVNYSAIMMNLGKSTLCQTDYPDALDCNPEDRAGDAKYVPRINYLGRQDPGAMDENRTRSCIRAANNIVRTANYFKRRKLAWAPLMPLGIALTILVLTKAYDSISSGHALDMPLRKMELSQITDNVATCSKLLHECGAQWPMATIMHERLRKIMLQNLPELYSVTSGEDLRSLSVRHSAQNQQTADCAGAAHLQQITPLSSEPSSSSSSSTVSIQQDNAVQPLPLDQAQQPEPQQQLPPDPNDPHQQQQMVDFNNNLSALGLDFFQMLDFM